MGKESWRASPARRLARGREVWDAAVLAANWDEAASPVLDCFGPLRGTRNDVGVGVGGVRFGGVAMEVVDAGLRRHDGWWGG